MNDDVFERLTDRLRAALSNRGARPAVVVAGKTVLTHQQLWERSGKIAAGLQRNGLPNQAVIALLMPKSADLIAAMIGVWRFGGVWLPIAPSSPPERIAFLLKDSQAEFVIGTPDTDQVGDNTTTINQLIANQHSAVLDAKIQPKDLAYLIYTSGTTGQPKGVEVMHRGLVKMLDQQIQAIGLNTQSRSLFLLSPSFDAAVSDIGTALLSGASIHIEPSLSRDGRLVASAKEINETIRRRQITYVDIPPALLAKLEPAHCPDSLQTILIGGEVCPPEVVRAWADRVRLINVYGPTEATICTSLSICQAHNWKRPLIGQPLWGVVYRIDTTKHHSNPSPPNETMLPETGELLIGGPCLARGYRGLPALTRKKFIQLDGQRFYRTGDLIRRDPDGEFVFLGRIDRQIKLRGHRIEPAEIETVILGQPEIEQCAVTKRQYDDGSEFLIAYLTIRQGVNKLSVEAIRKRLANRLPYYMTPEQFEFLDELPRTATGKIDYLDLQDRVLAPRRKPDIAVTQLQTELELIQVFRQVLQHDRFSLTDHFFSVGGDSLGAMEICALLQARGIRLEPAQLAAWGSVRTICDSLPIDNCDVDRMTAEEIKIDVNRLLLENPIVTAGQAQQATPGPQQCVLVTGSTGFLGTRILERLMKWPMVELICLVRAENDQAASERLRRVLKTQNIEFEAGNGSKLKAVAGDVSKPYFGWSNETYRRLAEKVDRVIHSAARVNLLASYSELHSCNVQGVHRVSQFVTQGKPKTFDYISTLSVFVCSDRFTGLMDENDRLDDTKFVYGGYAQSKWAAEQVLTLAKYDRQAIYRFGLLTADTRTGVYPDRDLLTLLIQNIARIGVVPILERNLVMDVTPVDHAADVFTHLIQRSDKTSQASQCFHIAHPIGLSAQQLFASLQRLLPKIKSVAVEEFENQINKLQIDSIAAAACRSLCRQLKQWEPERPDPFNVFQATDANFDMTHTCDLLAGSGINPPEIDDAFVDTMVNQLIGGKGSTK